VRIFADFACRGVRLGPVAIRLAKASPEMSPRAALRLLVHYASMAVVASTSASCPMVTKVACPLCWDVLEQWNADAMLPPRIDECERTREPPPRGVLRCHCRVPPH